MLSYYLCKLYHSYAQQNSKNMFLLCKCDWNKHEQSPHWSVVKLYVKVSLEGGV